jgi:putative flippase GtrA
MCERQSVHFIRAFGATVYFAVLALLLRLHQSAFVQGQEVATLSAMTVHFAIKKVLTYRDR